MNAHVEDVGLILLRFDQLEEKIDKLLNQNELKKSEEESIIHLDADHEIILDDLLDNQDMCTLLGVTKRTLQRYRQRKILSYYMLNNGKAYYKKSEIPDFLMRKIRS